MSDQPRCVCGETAPERLHHMTKWDSWVCVTCMEQTIHGLEEQVNDLDRQLDRALPSVPSAPTTNVTGKRVLARFVPQAWINNYAVDIEDGKVEFDCTEQILRMGREAALKIRDNRDEADELVPPEILRRHHGPFRVEVESAIRDFFAEEEGSS